jgi:hypothetical protein
LGAEQAHTVLAISPGGRNMDKHGTPYSKMTMAHKVRFIVKLAVCILTFGFVFPNIMGD